MMSLLPRGYRAVVVGASGGIGAAFINHLRADPIAGDVIALSRRSTPPLDLADEGTISRAAAQVGEYGPVHLLIDATGLLHDDMRGLQPEKSLKQLDPEHLAQLFAVNTTGPALLLKHFHGLFPKDERTVFASLSARVGSISDNRIGGWYGYRASKAALNMLLACAAIELARARPAAIVVGLHPGTVRTDLSAPFAGKRDLLEPDDAARRMLRVLDGLTTDQSGQVFDYAGQRVPA